MANITEIYIDNKPDFDRALGGKIAVTAKFSKNVFVFGVPILNMINDNAGLTVVAPSGDRMQWLEYVSGSGTQDLLFEYTLTADDVKSGKKNDVLSIGTSAIALNGGTIKDADNVDANITISQAIADASGTITVTSSVA